MYAGAPGLDASKQFWVSVTGILSLDVANGKVNATLRMPTAQTIINFQKFVTLPLHINEFTIS